MSFLYQAAGFFCQGKMKMIQRRDVYYVNINITKYHFEFNGTLADFGYLGTVKDSTGYVFDIPWSNVKDIIIRKERAMHVIVSSTTDNSYTILSLDPQHVSGLGIGSSKKNAIELLVTINEAKAQVESSKNNFCSNCGDSLEDESKFCRNCGIKLI